jgi:hypothetical protein
MTVHADGVTPTFSGKWVLWVGVALAACGGDDGGAGDSGDASAFATGTGGTSTSTSTTTTTTTTTTATTTTTTTTTATTTATTTPDESSGGMVEPGALPYEEDFAGEDGELWPAPWREIGTHVIEAVIDGGRARLSGETMQVARMAVPGFDELDVDVTVTVEFDDWLEQGFGFYVRQNGGALLETEPPGQGYAVYSEGGFQRTLGLWREIDGVETMIASLGDPIEGGVLPATPYRVRFQCVQEGEVTRLRAKMWLASTVEPEPWMVETTDAAPQLQGTSGSFAADVYNYSGTGSIWMDDLVITPAP